MTSEVLKRANLKYEQSEKGKLTRACYRESEEGKATDVRKSARYNLTEKGKVMLARKHKRYDQSEKGKLVKARVAAKRKRNLGYNPINKWSEGCVGHHIDKEDILYIPEELHQSIRHAQSDSESMKKINDAVFEWLCTQEVL